MKPFSGNCTANIKGLLRMEGMELQFCDGQQWVQVAGHSTVENSETNPGKKVLYLIMIILRKHSKYEMVDS